MWGINRYVDIIEENCDFAIRPQLPITAGSINDYAEILFSETDAGFPQTY